MRTFLRRWESCCESISSTSLIPEKEEKAEVSVFMAGFHEIEEFVRENGRLPEKGKSISERKLASRLKGIVENDEKREYLQEHDSENIISLYQTETGFVPAKVAEDEAEYSAEPKSTPDAAEEPAPPTEKDVVIPAALKGIAKGKAFADLMGGVEKERALFGGRFAKKPKKEQEMPDYVATRKDCADFEKFRPLFDECLAELKSGTRKAIPFKNEQHIEAGKFYVLGGLLCYVADKGKPYMHKGKRNTRLRLIFINERESDMLLRSLSTELYKGGLMITQDDSDLFDQKIDQEDVETGWIYVLRSLSDSPQVTAIPNLHKIGFTTTTVEERIAGAEKQVTYLMAPVEIAAKAKTANLSANKLEQIIHAVFGQVRLEIEVTDSNGETKQATEWFSAPWSAIEHAIQLIASGQIEFYSYNPESEQMEFRE
jgi:hypothetical protein